MGGNGAALPGDAAINYLDRLGLPALGVALSAGALAGLAIPGLVVGGVILAAALIFKRTLQGIRDEKRLTVDFLDASAVVLLTAQASFLAPTILSASSKAQRSSATGPPGAASRRRWICS